MPAPEPGRLERRRLAATDLYAALQRSLDTLQRRLASADNAFADFVVKDCSLDAAVQLSVNELGVLQLVLADDDMPASAISRLSLTLSAVAKSSESGRLPGVTPADGTALGDLDWLPPRAVAQLEQYDIRTAAELLGLAADARLITQVVSLLKLERAELGRWTDRLRLLELGGMSPRLVDMLGAFGIESLRALADLSDGPLEEVQARAESRLPAGTLQGWRQAARQLLARGYPV